MKNYINLIFLSLIILIISSSCKKEKTPAEMLVGKWIITSQELLGSVSAGDGSYLTFGACSSSCSGTDYRASDQTTSTFYYTLSDGATTIDIVDPSTSGGNYDFLWDILELSDTKFRMTTSTIFGNLKIEMTKE